MEEAALIAALKAGGAEAYRVLVADYGDRVYNTVLSLVQRPEDAEDIVQEVFTAVYQHIGRFRGDAKLSTWIYRIAVTKSLETLRRSSRRMAQVTDTLDEAAGSTIRAASFQHPGVRAEAREAAAMLFKALSRLPPQQKTAFVLHKSEGLSHAEVAAIMELSVAAVESLIYRARQGLQGLLAQYYRGT